MVDSPWNVKSRDRKPAGAGNPQTVQPAETSRGPQPETAKPPLPQLPETQGTKRDPPPPRKKRAAKKKRDPFPLIAGLVLFVLLAGMAAAAFSSAHENRRLFDLTQAKELEERRKQAHREEHLFARNRSGYSDLIEKLGREYGVSPSFISAVIKCESSFNPNAVSRVNARGLMQIMPDTGIWLADKLDIEDYSPERLFEPELNIRMGAYYLAYLSDQFNGSPVMVASAYHAGADNVKRWAMRDSLDQKTIALEQIPTDDTRSYVRKVMDAYAIYDQEDRNFKNGAVPVFEYADAPFRDGAGHAGGQPGHGHRFHPDHQAQPLNTRRA